MKTFLILCISLPVLALLGLFFIQVFAAMALALWERMFR